VHFSNRPIAVIAVVTSDEQRASEEYAHGVLSKARDIHDVLHFWLMQVGAIMTPGGGHRYTHQHNLRAQPTRTTGSTGYLRGTRASQYSTPSSVNPLPTPQLSGSLPPGLTPINEIPSGHFIAERDCYAAVRRFEQRSGHVDACCASGSTLLWGWWWYNLMREA